MVGAYLLARSLENYWLWLHRCTWLARVGAGPVLGIVTSFLCYPFVTFLDIGLPFLFWAGWEVQGDGSHECWSCAGV